VASLLPELLGREYLPLSKGLFLFIFSGAPLNSVNPAETLLVDINRRFVRAVGPIGELLIDDARRLWRQQQWRGPAAFRHYIKNLADNIDDTPLRQRFIKDADQLLMLAQRANTQTAAATLATQAADAIHASDTAADIHFTSTTR
jgi:hypothetical protein